jgi:hypothetical protein
MILRYKEFNEEYEKFNENQITNKRGEKLYIACFPFLIGDLIGSELFPTNKISKNMYSENDNPDGFDGGATGVFVSREEIIFDNDREGEGDKSYEFITNKEYLKNRFGKSVKNNQDAEENEENEENEKETEEKEWKSGTYGYDHSKIKIKKFFFTESKDRKGQIIEELSFKDGDNQIYLYVFDKYKNQNEREKVGNARQKHGFVYEMEIERTYGATRFLDKKTHEWDAVGKLNIEGIKDKMEDGFEVYHSPPNNENDIRLVNNSSLAKKLENFTNEEYKWNIKSCKKENNSTSIMLADYNRIAGLEETITEEGNLLVKKKEEGSDIKKFILVVGFYRQKEGELEFYEQYIIIAKVENWKNLFPTFDDDFLEWYANVREEMKEYILPGKKEEVKEQWGKFLNEKKIPDKNGKSPIRMAIKRTSPSEEKKGSVRIQASITYTNLIKNALEKNEYILIKKPD